MTCCERFARSLRDWRRGGGAAQRRRWNARLPVAGPGLILNSNLLCLNGRAVDRDLERRRAAGARRQRRQLLRAVRGDRRRGGARGRPDRAGADVVFGATLGTGVGGGIVIDGRVLNGANGAAAEWSHTTLPFLRDGERSPYVCPAATRAASNRSCRARPGGRLPRATGRGRRRPRSAGSPRRASGAARAFALYEDRLARALAGVINLLDPHIIVLGGGVSNNVRIFDNVPGCWSATRSPRTCARVVRAQHGDASGMRGAAWLW